MVKADYWDAGDDQVVEKTGKPIAPWRKVLDEFKAADKKSNAVVAHLQDDHRVPRYWRAP